MFEDQEKKQIERAEIRMARNKIWKLQRGRV